MEKLEYKARLKEMEHLVSMKKFQDAITVANTINWRKVHNINDLIVGSEAFEAAGNLEDAIDLLLIAHERSPIGRMILYKLCMISIKLKDLEMAQEYYNEFVQIAPHDSLKYILKYNISMAKEADNATLIKILEQLKEHDFLEEWAYELAYLYHKTNQADKCIDLCDEIVLWFGDGPIVERALELKMLYQPLDKSQENTYRHIQQKGDGLTEITAGEQFMSGEIVPHNIAIPPVNLSPERFNTINLQAEIKKNIDEIMNATEKGAVSENIDAIKSLVEEIPYLQVKEEAEVEEEKTFSINEKFQAYLEEETDGQISLLLPDDEPESEKQVEGQMTIDDVLAEWEKTKRAAEAAMEEAKTQELESAKAKALKEANNVLTRLEGAMSKLDAGMTSVDLLKEEYLSSEDDEEISSEEKNIENEQDDEDVQHDYIPSLEDYSSGFTIPKIHLDGTSDGSVDIPVVAAPKVAAAIEPIIPVISKEETSSETASWEPPTLDKEEETDDVDYKEASMMIADVNKMLQREIDRLTGESTVDSSSDNMKLVEEPTIELTVSIPDEEEQTVEIKENAVDDSVVLDEEKISSIEQDLIELEREIETNNESAEEPEEEDFVLPTIEIPADLFENEEQIAEIPVEEVQLEEEPPLSLKDDSLPIISEANFEPEEIVELVDEKVLTNVIKDEVPTIELDDEDLDVFSYFLNLNGMKRNITQVISGLAYHVNEVSSKGGNIVIVGEGGSGKTQMATSLIKVLQKQTGKPEGGIGKISGQKLNEKDIQKLFSKIQGGCLIVEFAGDISKETAVTLSLLMEQDKSGTIIILEDNKRGIDKALAKDASFAKRFTEKIVIPIFSIDELVSFAKSYAYEDGFVFDEMGVLALYNRINLISRYDHPTTIREVAEIMDDAMDNASRRGLFNKIKYDREGNILIREKDFEK